MNKKLQMMDHPGFKRIAQMMAEEQNYPIERASAILASRSRSASPAAKRKNPRMKKVRG